MFPRLILVALLVSGVWCQWEAILKLPRGDIKGSLEKYSKGEYTAFRGIPYAKSPTGSLRLRDPEEVESWSTVLDATTFRPKCPQWDILLGKVVGDEDCLFVNVFTPLSVVGGSSPRSSFPVMVFIHGGNFQRGSVDAYGPEWFVEKGVVLVTLTYRLGVLGFLSTGDNHCPGNLGLKDQVLALKWVRDNIQHFGGNSSSITLFGQGAGGASVFLHILSPQSQGLFRHAITQSGSPLCDWTVEESPRNYAVEVAQRLGCPTKSNPAMVDCIRRKPVVQILNAQKDEKTFADYPLRAIPVVEKQKDGFLPDTPAGLLSSGNFKPIPLMSGVNKGDGATFYQVLNSYGEMLKKNSSFLLTRLIPMFLLTVTDIRDNIESVSEALFFHYFRDVDPTDVSQVLQPFIDMTSDAMFVSCNYRTLQNYSAKGARTYMYTFQYKGSYSMLDMELGTRLDYKGVSHGDELLYLFNFKNVDSVSSDNLKRDQLIFIWTNFARTGESPLKNDFEFPKWEPYTSDLKQYYSIGKDLQSRTAYRQQSVDLWLSHLPALSQVRCGPTQPAYQTGAFGWAMLAIAIASLTAVAALAVILKRRKAQYSTTKTDDK